MPLSQVQLRYLEKRLGPAMSTDRARADAEECVRNNWRGDRALTAAATPTAARIDFEPRPLLNDVGARRLRDGLKSFISTSKHAQDDAMAHVKNAWRGDRSDGARGRASTRTDRAQSSVRADGIADREFRTDFMDALPKMTSTDEGFLRGDAIITRTGVFLYRNQDGSTRRELRHPDDVFNQDSLRSFEMLPITVLHPSAGRIDATNAKNLSVGHLGERIAPEGDRVRASLIITAQDGIQAIQRGVRQLSCGYSVELVPESGTYRGDAYDHRQTNIRGNHVALVDVGRAGPEARLNLDAALAESEQRTAEARERFLSEVHTAWRR